MRLGDVLLLQGSAENVKALEQGNLFNIFGGVDSSRLNTSHAAVALAIFALALLAATFKVVPLPVAVLGALSLCFLPVASLPKKLTAASTGKC